MKGKKKQQVIHLITFFVGTLKWPPGLRSFRIRIILRLFNSLCQEKKGFCNLHFVLCLGTALIPTCESSEGKCTTEQFTTDFCPEVFILSWSSVSYLNNKDRKRAELSLNLIQLLASNFTV